MGEGTREGDDLTLGTRLDAAARRRIEARRPRFGWLGPAQPVLARIAKRQAGFGGRFDRAEADPRALAQLPTDGPAGAPARGDRAAPAGEPQRWAPHSVTLGRAAPAGVRHVLRDVAGPGADSLRIHDDPPADAFARASAAAAVSVGPDVYVAGGRVGEDPAALSLLAHEAVHVAAAADPLAAGRRSGDGGIAAEEALALTAERRTRERRRPSGSNTPDLPETGSHRIAGTSRGFDEPATASVASRRAPLLPLPPTGPSQAGPSRAGPTQAGPTRASAQPAATPMRAAVDRPAAERLPSIDTEALRDGLMRDLLRQLRVEFERGG